MRKSHSIIALAVTMMLVGCQTVDGVTVNGAQLAGDTSRTQAQSGRSGWMWALGIAGAVGVGLLASSGGGGGSRSGSGPGGTGGTGGSGGMGGFGGDPCNGCWDY